VPTVKFLNANEVVVFEGHVALSDMDDYIAFGCRSGNCGMCAVRIITGHNSLSPRTIKEERLLSLIGVSDPSIRLACQSRAHDDVVLFEIN